MVIATARTAIVSVALSLCCVVETAEANLLWAVAHKVASLLLSEGIDRLWDKATGKPDVRALNERLTVVERAFEGSDPNASQIVRRLRTRVTPNTTRDEYVAMAAETFTTLSRRIADLERGVQHNTQAIEQLNTRLSDVERRINAGPLGFPSTGRIDGRFYPSLGGGSRPAHPLIGAWLRGYPQGGMPAQHLLRFNPDGSLLEISQDPYGRQAAVTGRYAVTENEVYIQIGVFQEKAQLTWAGPDVVRYRVMQNTERTYLGMEMVLQRVVW